MDLQAFLAELNGDDIEWIIPVSVGVVIVLGALLLGLVRGMTAGVLVAIALGGLMSTSPILLDRLQRGQGEAGVVSSQVAQGAAQLAMLNAAVVTDLSRVVSTLRTSVAGLAPLVSAQSEAAEADPQVAQRFARSLTDTEERLDDAIGALERVNAMRERLEADMETLELEIRRATASGG